MLSTGQETRNAGGREDQRAASAPPSPARPMTAGAVLDMHARLQEALRNPDVRAARRMDRHMEIDRAGRARSGEDGRHEPLFPDARDGKALCGIFSRDLFSAVTYQVTAEMTTAVHAMYANGKDSVLHPEELPAEAGFAWLDEPVAITRSGGQDAGPALAVDALSWAAGSLAGAGGRAVPGVRVTAWTVPGPSARPLGEGRAREFLSPSPGLPLVPLLSPSAVLGQGPAVPRGGGGEIILWARALWTWMNTELTAVRRDPVSRACRRRASRALRLDDVNVITLRRARSATDDTDGEPVPVEWSCCWIVRGHHRHQRLVHGARPHHAVAAGADRGHCATCGGEISWVHGYIKGPDNLPLRLHDRTLYRLSR